MKTMSKTPPEVSSDGQYPTEDYLRWLAQYKPSKEFTFQQFIEHLRTVWWMPDWGFGLKRKYGDYQGLELHTGGWSGNEEIIGALMQNSYLYYHWMNVQMWRAGGHYYFKLRLNDYYEWQNKN
jgi:hypothetical protein